AILVPFTFLPFGVAFGLWQAVQLAAWGGLLFVLLRENPALPRPEFMVAAAATVVGLVFAGGLLALGPGVYVEWARAVSGIEWAGYPSNASLLGLAERTLPSDALRWV